MKRTLHALIWHCFRDTSHPTDLVREPDAQIASCYEDVTVRFGPDSNADIIDIEALRPVIRGGKWSECGNKPTGTRHLMAVEHKRERAVRSTRTGRQVKKKCLAQNGTDATEETYCGDSCSITQALSGEGFVSEGQLEAEIMVGACNT
jgi:hypothetical protein